MPGREPPVRILTAGRVLRPDQEDRTHLKVFHQADVLCIQPGANLEAMKTTVARVMGDLVETGEIRWCQSE